MLIFIPPAQWENGLTYTIPQLGRMEGFQLAVSVPMTFRQSRAPVVVSPRDITDTTLPEKVFDFAPAPAGYTLINLRAGFKLPLGEHSLGFTFTAENLLNTTYRNYMNRLRYYADDVGSNFIVRVSYNFLSH